MAESIYHLNEQGHIEPMTEESFALEDTLQELVADHPELLSGEQIDPTNPRRWILIKREQGIADTEGGSYRWALDHLLIDQDAVPTLIEVKRSASSEIRRTIVGQMLDYAAHARHTWNAGDIRQDFEASTEATRRDPDTVLAELLQSEDEPDADEFWQRVETNLRVAHMRLLFVADRIPDELTRVVEFLNEQMPNIEVLAVEIKQFRGKTGRTLVPRVIGRTAAALARSPRSQQGDQLNEQMFIDSFTDEKVRQAAIRLLEVAHEHKAAFNWNQKSVTIRAKCPQEFGNWRIVAWLCKPSETEWMGAGGFIFGAGNRSADFFENLPDNLRECLESWVNQFSEDHNVTAISHPNIKGWSVPYEEAAANIDALAERLENVLRSLQQLEVAEG